MSAPVIATVRGMQAHSRRVRGQGHRVVVVPTMGALHDGHISLIRIARQAGDHVVTTIFVNPTQFGPQEDLARYPRSFDSDISRATDAGTHVVFAPSVEEMYPAGFQTFVVNDRLSGVFEGEVRPGHFRGVATVVTKLFLATEPHAAVFGQKDAQQVAVVRALVRDLGLDLEVIVGPIVREPDGLAMSSRNIYLTPEQRAGAPALHRALRLARTMVRDGERKVNLLRDRMRREIEAGSPTSVDYIAFVRPDTFETLESVRPEGMLAVVAVRFGPTRLLDNMLISEQGEPD